METQTMEVLEAAQDEPSDDLDTLVGGRHLIIASNRGPVEFHQGPDGRLIARRGPGGVVTALAALARELPLTWVAAAMTAGDREAFPDEGAPAREARLGQQTLRVRYVAVPPERYHRYYDQVSNSMLWFLQHYLWDPAHTPTFGEQHYADWDEGYRMVNEAIASAVADEALAAPAGRRRSRSVEGADTIVLLQDYHLYLAPAQARARLPRATVQQFIHIPWPAERYWQFLPERFLLEIYEALAANDVLGFQTPRDVRNFLVAARELLTGCRVDLDRGVVIWRRHRLLARAYPVPVDATEVRGALASAAGRRSQREMAEVLGGPGQLIVRVDRLDPTKNIVRGFEALAVLLRRHAELRERVRMLAFLVPSRQSLPIYRRYERDVRAAIRRVNDEFGTATWQPIMAFFENNRHRALAALARYDALIVNPIIDGMNLVAKEGPAVNSRDGVLVLSRTAGAFDQLHDAALPVTPTDVAETAEQLYEALAMAAGEREHRARLARQVVERESPALWVRDQLRDAARVHAPAGVPRERRLSRAG